MFKLNATVALAGFAVTILASAGIGYVVSQATMTAQVALSCPASDTATHSTLARSFPPIGNLPPLTGGRKF